MFLRHFLLLLLPLLMLNLFAAVVIIKFDNLCPKDVDADIDGDGVDLMLGEVGDVSCKVKLEAGATCCTLMRFKAIGSASILESNPSTSLLLWASPSCSADGVSFASLS